MTIVGLIPARGGSKSIPRKNLVNLGGAPLIAWTIRVALGCPILGRVIVSTDDTEIASVAEGEGADVPFVRPSELATDNATDDMVYHHAVNSLARRDERPDIIVWLRPTSPFRMAKDIKGTVSILKSSSGDVVRSICKVSEHPYWMKELDDGRLKPVIAGKDETKYPRRQLLPPVYRLNGAVEAFKVEKVAEGSSIYRGDVRPFVMPKERSVDIDTPMDLAVARCLVRAGILSLSDAIV